MLRHFLLVAVLACTGCGIKGPLYLPPPAQATPAATPPAATPPAAPGPSNPLPPGSPVEPKKN
jgi:predicted small lipoprotein YifL